MDRLLSPNETKFWLLDVSSPMNVVTVVHLRGRPDPGQCDVPEAFRLPSIFIGHHGRPRWGGAQTGGTVEVLEEADAGAAWAGHAERLLQMRLGSEGYPPFHVTFLCGESRSALLLAIPHALADYRSALWLADAFLEGIAPGGHAPACEELLPLECYTNAGAETLIDGWWSQRAALRWEAAGVDTLTGALPEPCRTRLSPVGLSKEQTAGLDARCAAEGVNLNSAVAVAIRNATGLSEIAHAVDMTRFIEPEPPSGPGLAISHVFTNSPDGMAWDAARSVHAQLFDRLYSGAAADALLTLPVALEQGAVTSRIAAATITGAPSQRNSGCAGTADVISRWVVSSARGGGFVVGLAREGDSLQLIGCLREEDDGNLIGNIAAQLLEMSDIGVSR